jgi:hypothetical protein
MTSTSVTSRIFPARITQANGDGDRMIRYNTRSARCVLGEILAFCLTATAPTLGLSDEHPRPASTVVKLTHLAVILPELDETRKDWKCQLWTPTIKQVTRAERAILRRIKDLSKANGKPDIANAHFIIQYFGLVLEDRRCIACFIVDVRTFTDDMESGGPRELNKTIETLFTRPYELNDSDFWLDAFYDPSTDKLSESMGILTAEPAGKSTSQKKSRRSEAVEQRGPVKDTKMPNEQSDDPFRSYHEKGRRKR